MCSSLFPVEFKDWGMQIIRVPQVKYTSAYYFLWVAETRFLQSKLFVKMNCTLSIVLSQSLTKSTNFWGSYLGCSHSQTLAYEMEPQQ